MNYAMGVLQRSLMHGLRWWLDSSSDAADAADAVPQTSECAHAAVGDVCVYFYSFPPKKGGSRDRIIASRASAASVPSDAWRMPRTEPVLPGRIDAWCQRNRVRYSQRVLLHG
jgi:hypothetical protein